MKLNLDASTINNKGNLQNPPHICWLEPPSQQMCGGSSSRRTVVAPHSTSFQQSARSKQNNSLPEISCPQPALFVDPILMNNSQGIVLYQDTEGGPTIRQKKLFPIRKRAS
jgi:hypothetical protein